MQREHYRGRGGDAEHIAPLLEAYHAGTLPTNEAATVERHLRACAACQEESDAIALYRLIRAAPAPTVGPELRERVYARIGAASMPAPTATAPSALRERQGQPLASPLDHARGARRGRGWLSGAAAVIIVALLASAFLALPHLRGDIGQGSAPARSWPTGVTRACPAGSAAKLPANAYINDLAMTSADGGWAVGGIADGQGMTARALLLRFSDCHLAPYALDLSDVHLDSISMDSPMDGWAVGNNNTTLMPALLHYSAGAWKQVALPRQAPVQGSFDMVRMRAPGDGWIIMNGVKNSQGLLSYELLRYTDGSWSSFPCPLPVISDVAPVGPNDIWVTGLDSLNGDAGAVRFAHYHDGQWTVMPQPTGAGLNDLRVISPTDIWASGDNVKSQVNGYAYPFVAHYDGATWQAAPQAIPPDAGSGEQLFTLGDGAGWAFRITVTQHDQAPQNQATPQDFTPDTTLVTGVSREAGGKWQVIGWPFKDIVLVRTLTSGSAGDIWAVGTVGKYVTWSVPNGNGGHSGGGGFVGHSVLLHYANGVWTRYD
ncbi:MAG: zf-HC2 domain-containing protein [Chloroflexota bacterium]|nr:zf-HC2 domain-containing protein [Chloroflexota bacterium]